MPVRRGSRILLTLGNPQGLVMAAVPNLEGMGIFHAEETLRELGLEAFFDDIGFVTGQLPGAGVRLPMGGRVMLW
jgi:hypothetical protein